MSNNVDTQDWTEAYKEIAKRITDGMPEIKWVDLWTEQTSYEAEEYPFGLPAVFIEFDTTDITTLGKGVQDMNCVVTFYLVYDTLEDSYQGSFNQDGALAFMTLCTKLNQLLHGKAGIHFSSPTRISLGKEPAPHYMLNYRQQYTMIIRDYTAMKDYPNKVTDPALKVDKGTRPSSNNDKLFNID